MIGIADYGLGNVGALLDIYRRNGVDAQLVSDPGQFDDCNGAILPGVGSFDWAMSQLNDSGLREALDQFITDRPVLGICVGMQMMARTSEEGQSPGLGWMDAEVRRMQPPSASKELPHMGWNTLDVDPSWPLFENLGPNPEFYFLHSYCFVPKNPQIRTGHTSYGHRFASTVGFGNVLGVQFHPEKSHKNGVSVLLNFAANANAISSR